MESRSDELEQNNAKIQRFADNDVDIQKEREDRAEREDRKDRENVCSVCKRLCPLLCLIPCL